MMPLCNLHSFCTKLIDRKLLMSCIFSLLVRELMIIDTPKFVARFIYTLVNYAIQENNCLFVLRTMHTN